MKTLIIVESPTKAKTLNRYLSKDYKIIASKGHVRDLPKSSLAIDIEKDFKPNYEVSQDRKSLISDMKKELGKVDRLLLATDEDREGEAISYHLVQVLKPKVETKRMVFHEITKSAILKALETGRDIDLKLVEAQESRRIIDRLYGYQVSPILWKKLANKKLSAGRVQSVGLRFIVEKEIQRLNYNTNTFSDIKASYEEGFSAVLASYKGHKIASSKDFNKKTGAFDNKDALLLNSESVVEVLNSLGLDNIVKNVEEKKTFSKPLPPFTTSTLQQAASSRLRMNAKETMRVAQSLFENGYITYMRTDSVNLSDECISAIRNLITQDYGTSYLADNIRRAVNNSKSAQEAHEAIRPSGDSIKRPEDTPLSGRELSLYSLIYARTMQTQMKDAIKSTTKLEIANNDAIFTVSGTTVLFPGYLKAYKEDNKEEVVLPMVAVGDKLTTNNLECVNHETKPPQRYTEASLIKKLEKKNIGRPSTYASIISTLLEREYVIEKDRTLIPSFQGFAVYSCMLKLFKELVDYDYTSEMEEKLDHIAIGDYTQKEYLNNFYYSNNQNKGLKDLLGEAGLSEDDFKELVIPTLSTTFKLKNDFTCTISYRIGPYGAYILTKDLNGEKLIVNIPPAYLPGELKERDIIELLESSIYKEDSVNNIVLKSGPHGQYWQQGDKIASVPKGKKLATEYTLEEKEYLLSLPKVIATKEGKDVLINNGPYGAYLSYMGKNHRVPSVFITSENALAIVDKDSSGVVYEAYKGKELAIKNGRYGAYLKWGDDNIKLTKAQREDLSSLTQEEAEKLCDANVSEAICLFDDKPITLHKGRYGAYLKYDGANYKIPKGSEVNAETVVNIIQTAKGAVKTTPSDKNTLKVYDNYQGKTLVLATGRYGAYLKWGDKNIRLQKNDLANVEAISSEVAISYCDKSIDKPLASYNGIDILLKNGRYGEYLSYNKENYKIPKDIELNAETAIEIVKKGK